MEAAIRMFWHFYVRTGTAVLPTVAQTDAGYYLDIEPVEVVPTADAFRLRNAIVDLIRRGNPRIATPTRETFPKPVALKHVNIASWSSFERTASCWKIVEQEGAYRVWQMRRAPDRGWDDGEQTHDGPFFQRQMKWATRWSQCFPSCARSFATSDPCRFP